MRVQFKMRRWLILAGLLMTPGLAFGQAADYSAGKTPAQLFSSDCSACHKTTRGLAKGKDVREIAAFLREHYTTRTDAAGALAEFVRSGGNANETIAPGAKPAPGTKPKPAVAGGEPPAGKRQPRTPAPVAAVTPGAAATPALGGGEATPPDADKRPPAAETPAPAEVRTVAAPAASPVVRGTALRAAEDAMRAKIRAYATTGEEARPKDGPIPAPATAAPALVPSGSEPPASPPS